MVSGRESEHHFLFVTCEDVDRNERCAVPLIVECHFECVDPGRKLS